MAQQKINEGIVQDVLRLLQGAPKGLEVSEIAAGLSGSDISSRSLRMLINRLEREKQLVKRKTFGGKPGAPPYRYLHPDHVVHQPGLFDNIPGIERAEIKTRSEVEQSELSPEDRARQARGTSVLQKIAESHLSSDAYAAAIVEHAPQFAAERPVDMLLDMAEWMVADLNNMGNRFLDAVAKNEHDEAEDLARELDTRLSFAKKYFRNLFRLDRAIETIPGIMAIPARARNYRGGETADLNRAAAETRLHERIIGDRMLDVITPNVIHKEAVGTDASVADIYLPHAQGSFVPPDPVYIMTAAAAMKVRSDGGAHEYQDFDIHPDKLDEYREIRAATEGLVLSPALKGEFGEANLKHARSAAMDLRQYHQDLRAVQRDSSWRPIGEAPLAGIKYDPNLLFRDGRLFPLVHRIKDFEADRIYGEIVRNEVERFATTLRQVFGDVYGDKVYAAAVKSPTLSWLAPLVFWYLHHKDIKDGHGKRIVTDEAIYRYLFPDTAVSHLLFLGLAKAMGSLPANSVFVTCRVLRRYSDIAPESLPAVIDGASSIRLVRENSVDDWREYIRQRIEQKERHHEEVILDEGSYRHFVQLCATAAASTLYAAPCVAYESLIEEEGSGAHFLIPRLEVAVETTNPGREQHYMESMLGWLATGGFELDFGHSHVDFEAGDQADRIPILVPDVVLSAHEAAGFTRTKLHDEIEQDLHERIAKLSRFFRKTS